MKVTKRMITKSAIREAINKTDKELGWTKAQDLKYFFMLSSIIILLAAIFGLALIFPRIVFGFMFGFMFGFIGILFTFFFLYTFWSAGKYMYKIIKNIENE